MLGMVTGYAQASDAGALVAEWVTNGSITSYPSMHRLDLGIDVALVSAWNPPTENAIDSLVVEFAGSMYDLGNWDQHDRVDENTLSRYSPGPLFLAPKGCFSIG
ncbi:hypothetical protein QE397_000014 [Rhodococcus sp. SORGH_AS 301]|nr:hypothetical protein [Rhodococcus sp. SORGH_AS_0301]